MSKVVLDDVRRKAIALLERRVNDIRLRSLEEFSHIDDAIFYAERQDKAFNLCVVDNVNWDSPVSSYVEEPDDNQSKSVLMVDVANGLDGNEQEIVALYDRWFGDTKGVA